MSRKPTKISEFHRRFWGHMMQRHPSEGDASVPYGANSKWRELPELRLVVAQYLSYRGPGVFIRCPRGGDDEAAAELLGAHERELSDRLGAEIGRNPRYLFIKQLKLDLLDERHWDRSSDWLKRQADTYETVLRFVFGSSSS